MLYGLERLCFLTICERILAHSAHRRAPFQEAGKRSRYERRKLAPSHLWGFALKTWWSVWSRYNMVSEYMLSWTGWRFCLVPCMLMPRRIQARSLLGGHIAPRHNGSIRCCTYGILFASFCDAKTPSVFAACALLWSPYLSRPSSTTQT